MYNPLTRKVLVWAFGLLACVASAQAQTSELPPLIDRELFFGDPEIAGGQLSPDGKFIAFIKPLDGTRNVWVKRIDEPFEKARERKSAADLKPGTANDKANRAIPQMNGSVLTTELTQ